MSKIRGLFFHGKPWFVFLEAWVLIIIILFLILSVVGELPQINIAATFIFLVQIPVGWAALRLKPFSGSFNWKDVLWETSFAAALRIVVGVSVWVMVSLYQAQPYLQLVNSGLLLNLLLHTPCFFPYLLYRLFIKLLCEWQALSQKRLLWMMVNSHLVTVFIIIVLALILVRVTEDSKSIATYYPPGWLAKIVLDFIRSIVPWVGVSVLLILAAIAVFFPPTLLVSYFSSRRFVRRISNLAETMKKVRQGDLSARVMAVGKDEIAQLQDDFNNMTDELQRAQHQLQEERDKVAALLKNQRELAAVVSHELRTPVSVMRISIENNLNKLSESLPVQYIENLQILHHEALTLQNLVEDLFTLSQLDERRLGLACAWIDAAKSIEQIVLSHKKSAWENKRIDLSASVQPDLPSVWADERRLEQVLTNLVQNSLRHTPVGGVIVLQAEPLEGFLAISVSDSGEGILPEDLPHIWERYYRGGKGGEAGRTGIGLSLVKELVEAMGGIVGVESRPKEGSRFWIRLKTNVSTPE
jgi:two-component system sensor histidine kinase BaeS